MKSIFTMLLCVIGVSVSFAQESSNPLSFGVKGGANVTALRVENPDGGFVAGGFGGLYTNYRVSEKFAVQLEVQYGQHGVYSNVNSDVTIPASMISPDLPQNMFGTMETLGRVNIRTEYLSIPVVAQYYLGEKKNFAIEAGAVFSFLTRSEVEFDGTSQVKDIHLLVDGNQVPAGIDDIDITETTANSIEEGTQFKKFDFALTAGAAYYIPNTNFNINSRVVYGLTDVADNTTPDDWKKTINFQFGLGYTF
ncbi:porin family protein [Sediminitomix flava]|uniref:Outer membrane protein with beta-barrel domain n=1 Tax=Sediminitomix flava TaxID=379075 RepID=A0A315ZGR1_SEDFL|nr:porin family protein [Sediminitomix flava]PWJ43924.1 outer membrane protein with beta-barrel domain [Sediminitomix flava]